MANDIAGVLLHGFGFMFLFTAFQTSTVIEVRTPPSPLLYAQRCVLSFAQPSVLQSNETEGGLGDRGGAVRDEPFFLQE